jgi:ATP-dependent Clp protease ATP-binding subunit ClpX
MMWIDNIDLTFDEDALRLIAKNASEKKTGARALRGVLDKVLADLMFEYGGYNEKKVKLNITKDMVEKYLDSYKENNKQAA